MLSYLRKDYLDGLRQGNLKRLERGTSGWIAVVLFIRYFVNCVFAAVQMRRGNLWAGRAMMEFNLLYVFVVWLLLPALLESLAPEPRSLGLRRLAIAPLSAAERLGLAALGVLRRPVYWVLLFCSLASLFPLFFLEGPGAIAAAGFFFVLFCLAASWLGSLLAAALPDALRRLVGVAGIVISLLLLLSLDTAFYWDQGSLYCFFGIERVLILGQGGAAGILASTRPWAPSAWVMGAADRPVWGVLLPLAAAGLAGACCFGLLSALGRREPRKPGRLWRVRPPNVSRAPLFYELDLLARRADVVLSALGAVLCGLLLAFTGNAVLLRFGLPACLFMASSAAFNSFGAELGAMPRYRLYPMTGRRVMATKNLAFLAIACSEIAVLFVGAVIGGLAVDGAVRIFFGVFVVLLYVMWGNVSSLLAPARVEEVGIAEARGGMISQFFAAAVWYPPYRLERRLGGGASLIGAAALMAAVCVGLYFLLLPSFGKLLEGGRESEPGP